MEDHNKILSTCYFNLTISPWFCFCYCFDLGLSYLFFSLETFYILRMHIFQRMGLGLLTSHLIWEPH